MLGCSCKRKTNTAEWTMKNKLATISIGLSADDSLLIHVRNAEITSDAWENLKKYQMKPFIRAYNDLTLINWIPEAGMTKVSVLFFMHDLERDAISLLLARIRIFAIHISISQNSCVYSQKHL